MEKFLEALTNLEKSFSRFEGLANNHIDNLVASMERRREALAEAQEKAVKKAKDLEIKKELSVKVDKLYRKLKKLGLFDEVMAH